MDDTGRLVIEIADRSRSKEGRPRMTDDVERRLDDLERRSARAYATTEYTAHRIDKLIEMMTADEDEAVPEAWGDNDFQDSTVHHIEGVRAALEDDDGSKKKK